MTTIVLTETEIAYDSWQVFDGVERNVSPTDKVRCPRPGVIMAFAGDTDDEARLFNWLAAGGHEEDKPLFEKDKSDFVMVVITKKAGKTVAHYYCEQGMAGTPISLPYCLGSGAHYARGALNFASRKKLKISAKEAVEAAADSDVNTGGEIKSAKVEALLAAPKKRRRRK